MTTYLRKLYVSVTHFFFGWALKRKDQWPWVYKLPNRLTAIRGLTPIPIYVALRLLGANERFLAYCCIPVVMFLFLTDAMDGVIARALAIDHRSSGKLFDAIMDKFAVDLSLIVLWLNHTYGLHGGLVILVLTRLVLDFVGMTLSIVRHIQGFTPGSGNAGKIKFHFDVLAVYTMFIASFSFHVRGYVVEHAIAGVALAIACVYSLLSLSHHIGVRKGAVAHVTIVPPVDRKTA